jgi:carboxymethylenebutenolidase
VCLAGIPGGRSEPPAPRRDLPAFLQLFKGEKGPPVGGKEVSFASAVGTGTGYVARPETREVLPAVLLIAGEEGLTDWLKESARDLASVGYVVLAVAPPSATRPDEQALAELWAALRWLRRRPGVLADRVGIVGWSRGGGLALELAAAAPVQACVVCDAPVLEDPTLAPTLRGTAVLGLFAGQDSAAQKALPAFRKALAESRIPHKIHVYDGARAGFLGPPERKAYNREAADRAWVEVYEFLGKYVEDGGPAGPAAAPASAAPAVATIADLMRAVNEPTGVRGALTQALEQEPAGPRAWDRVRADAALVAEAGTLLQGRTPPKGSRGHWLEQARSFTAAAETLVSAADLRDYAAARRGLKELGERCAACHEQHR